MADLNDFDELDKRIIEQLSTSSEGSFRQIAKILGVHPTTLIQRVKNLKNKGVITGYRAKIDYMKLGFGYMGFETELHQGRRRPGAGDARHVAAGPGRLQRHR